jgi:hypothetical protein
MFPELTEEQIKAVTETIHASAKRRQRADAGVLI